MTTRVLQVVSRLGWGGAERVAEALAVGLAERGVDSAVLAVAGAVDAPSAERMRTVLRAGGVEVLGGSHLRSAKLAAIDAPRWLLRAVRSFHPDLVH
ncbi:MAG: glycosyltransferase, partial [Thermoleophilaceae bacterium]